MAEYQQLIDDMRSFLSAADQTRTAEVEQWAQEYARWCKEANGRLRQCREYLQRGLRSEALHAADKYPALLDVVTALDFPEVQQWRELCVQYALPEPPALAVESAQALNDAYAEESPLQGILAAHRALNLAQAPLGPRIGILRKIVAADPITPHWEDDLKKIEKLRMQEIGQEAARAMKVKDIGTLKGLAAEISSTEWRATVPAQVRQEVERSLLDIQLEAAEKSVRETLPELNAAYSAMDFDECKEKMELLDAIVSRHQLPLPADVADQIESVRGWLQGQEARKAQAEAFEEACAVLQQALDTDAATPELERRFQVTVGFAQELPESLEKRYQKRLRDREAAGRRRSLLIVSSAIAAVLIVLGGLGLWYYNYTRSAELHEWVERTDGATRNLGDSHDVDKAKLARKGIVEEGSRFLKEPDLAAALTGLDDAVKKEELRAAGFAEKMKRADAAPADSPDEASLKAAKDLAATNAEKLAVSELEERISDYQQKKAREADDQFVSAATALRQEIDKDLTPGTMAADKRTYMTKIAEAEAQVAELQANQVVSSSLKSSLVETLEVMLKQKKDAMGREEAEEMQIETVIASWRSCDDRIAALKLYCDRYPSGSKAADFSKALRRADAEKSIVAWDTVCKQWPDGMPRSAGEATSRLSQVEDYLHQFSTSPLAAAVGRYRDFLKNGIAACSDDGGMLKVIKPLMSSDLMTEVFVVVTSDGKPADDKMYYTPERPKITRDSLGETFPVYRSENLRRADPLTLPKGVTAKSLAAKETADHSPQGIVAELALSHLAELKFSNWMDMPLVIGEDVMKAEKLNPVMKGRMLQRLLQVQDEDMGWAMGETFKDTVSGLADLNLNDVTNWMDPDNPVGSGITDPIDKLVANCPDFAKQQQAVQATLRDVILAARPTAAGYGVLASRPGEALQVHTSVILKEGMTAEVLKLDGGAATSGGPFSTLIIGAVHDGHMVLDASKAAAVPEGSLVFLREKR